MPINDCIKRSDALKAILGVSIYDTIEELEGARTIAENTWADGLWDAYKIIEEEVDAADVEPVRHGRWIPGKRIYSEYNEGRLVARYYDQWTCSVCNYVINDQHYSRISYKRCPECGAHMNAEPPKEEDDA